MANIVVVDDEPAIRELVGMGLRFRNFEVTVFDSGRPALEHLRTARPDLVILDVMLPDLDGFEIARRIRQQDRAGAPLPVIFLTARDTTDDKIEGLRLGGDDYVTKPFSIEELLLRVEAVLRRSGVTSFTDERLRFADLVLDESTREVWRGDRPIELTATEYRLLQYLLINARRVLSRQQILEQVWDYTFEGNASVLETYISYLRQKLDAGEQPLIHTVRGVGYSLREARTA